MGESKSLETNSATESSNNAPKVKLCDPAGAKQRIIKHLEKAQKNGLIELTDDIKAAINEAVDKLYTNYKNKGAIPTLELLVQEFTGDTADADVLKTMSTDPFRPEINDRFLIDQAREASKYLYEKYPEEYKNKTNKELPGGPELVFPFPLDEDTIEVLGNLLPKEETSNPTTAGINSDTPETTENKEEIPYSKAKKLNELWIELIKKSIQCLRFFDTREAFQQDKYTYEENKNRIEAYGIESLKDYQKHYVEFERMLYGQNERYRDHVFHSFRDWLLGVFLLTKEFGEGEPLIDKLELDGGAEYKEKINYFEWLSMWTIAALCHDLGYSLELVGSILDKTNAMMSDFFLRPNVSDNFTFTATQGNFNDHILGLMSTKLCEAQDAYSAKIKIQQDDLKQDDLTLILEPTTGGSSKYSGRIQQKYYFKYLDSLENNDHGIISAAIVFRKLPFFLESDFHLNDNSYRYEKEDARQFYIRREILRAMSSHNCDEIFYVKIQTLPALLFICDELQEWGRKSWNDFYTGTNPSETKLYINRFDRSKVDITEKKSMPEPKTITKEHAKELIIKEYRLCEKYKKTFRDGPGDAKREFDFEKEIIISVGEAQKELNVWYIIHQGKQDKFAINADKLDSTERENLKELIKEADNLDPEERDYLVNSFSLPYKQ